MTVGPSFTKNKERIQHLRFRQELEDLGLVQMALEQEVQELEELLLLVVPHRLHHQVAPGEG